MQSSLYVIRRRPHIEMDSLNKARPAGLEPATPRQPLKFRCCCRRQAEQRPKAIIPTDTKALTRAPRFWLLTGSSPAIDVAVEGSGVIDDVFGHQRTSRRDVGAE
jgi:hypothetical protein